MKILHTSDLHLGHRLLERSRLEEQAALLEWLVQIIRQEEVDLLIIAGDIFDTGSPPNSALSLYYDFLHRVADTACRGTIIIGGNHDSVARAQRASSSAWPTSVSTSSAAALNLRRS